MKHMEIVPAALPEGLTLTFFRSDKYFFLISQLKKRSCFNTQDSVPLSGAGFLLDLSPLQPTPLFEGKIRVLKESISCMLPLPSPFIEGPQLEMFLCK